jgi:hypothetical protein
VSQFVDYYKHKGHVFGECMSHPDTNLMYVHIPKNASSWTKPNLKDWGWEFYNYRCDSLYSKHAIIVLRDPVERWLSGIAEYMCLYHSAADTAHFSKSLFDLIFDRIAFDDHTEKQCLFIDGLDFDNCTFFWCDKNYRQHFSKFLNNHGMNNRYFNYDYQHVTEHNAERQKFKTVFQKALEQNSKYLNNLKKYFVQDYQLIETTKFYAG